MTKAICYDRSAIAHPSEPTDSSCVYFPWKQLAFIMNKDHKPGKFDNGKLEVRYGDEGILYEAEYAKSMLEKSIDDKEYNRVHIRNVRELDVDETKIDEIVRDEERRRLLTKKLESDIALLIHDSVKVKT